MTREGVESLASLHMQHTGSCFIHIEFLTDQLIEYQVQSAHIGMLLHKILIPGKKNVPINKVKPQLSNWISQVDDFNSYNKGRGKSGALRISHTCS